MASEFFKTDKNRLFGLLISIVIFIILTVIYSQLTLFDGLEKKALDFKFEWKAPDQKSEKLEQGVTVTVKNPNTRDDIIILGINADTVSTFTNMGIIWPYPWNIHAKFNKYVGSGKPLAIFYDIMWLDHQEYEHELAESIKDTGNVFINYPFETDESDVKYTDIEDRLKILEKFRMKADPNDKSEVWVKEYIPPVPEIALAAAGVGFANVQPDSDYINRKMPLIIKFNNFYYLSDNLLVVMRYYGITKDDIEIKMGRYIKLKNLPVEKMAKPNNEHEIKIPIDEKGFMDINFAGGYGSYNFFPYYYFYQDGVFDNPSLQDKILLVAAYSITGIATDTHKSPYGTMFGIEHKANALNTILNQDFLIKFSTLQNIFVLLIIALVFGFILPRISIIKSIIITVLILIVYFFGSLVLFDYLRIDATFASPIIQIFITFAIIIAYRVLTEQKEKKYIRQTFSKLVSKSVVDELLKYPEKVKLGGEKKVISVLFSDIRGFTTLSEKLQPEELVVHLNEYLEAMTNIVTKYEGTLDKYIGDAIMAFWGAPIPQEDHALLACRAAVEMNECLKQLNVQWKSEGKQELHIGIGINSGDMVVALMGSSSRMNYTLMGDNVNLGSRLEGITKEYKVSSIISEFTYEFVKDSVIVRELDLVRVKGKALPVKIYELIDMKE
jgi:adenylate cyclase